MPANPWATATDAPTVPTTGVNPWAAAVSGGVAAQRQAAAAANVPVPAPSLLSTVGSDIMKGAQGLIQPAEDAFTSGVQQTATGINEGGIPGAFDIASGVATGVMSPLATVLSPISKVVNFLGDKIANIPAVQKFAMSPQGAKAIQSAQDEGNLMNILGTVLGGAEAIHGEVPEIKPIVDSEGKSITPNPITKLPVEGDTTPRPLPVTNESPVETPVTPNKGDGTSVEPITPQTPATAPGEAPLPTIQANAEEPQTAVPSATIPTETPTSVPNESTATPTLPQTTGGDVPTKGATDISANLVKEGEAALSPDEMASYKSGSYKDSAATAETLKAQDPEALKQMAITGKGIPEGVFPKILYNLVEKDAIESKDYALQRELAKSPLNTEASTHAGQLGAGGYNKVSDSPVEVLKKAIDDRAGGAKGKAEVAKEAAKAKSTITKAAAKMMDYQSIIDAIKTC